MADGGKIAHELFDSGNPFIASIVPNLLMPAMKTEEGEDNFNRIHPPENYYPDWAIEIFRENKHNPNVVWAQEGYRHCCGKCYNNLKENNENGLGNWPDPYHEHVCLDGSAQFLEKQIEVIGKGKKLIKNVLEIKPLIYCPPNHLYNNDTLRAVNENNFAGFLTRNGFDYLIPDLIELPAYGEKVDNKTIIIFPETKKGKSPLIMTYYNHICNGNVPNWKELLENSKSINKLSLDIRDKPKFKAWANKKLIFISKEMRDKTN